MNVSTANLRPKRKTLSLLGFLSAWLIFASMTQAAVVYVDHLPPTAVFDGTSWSTAFNRLEDAITAAQEGDEIWVAAGTYRPTTQLGNRAASFSLKNRVQIYGGFDSTETSRDERAGLFDQTILSGDINNTPETGADNSYHVVFADATVQLGARLDGFTIEEGFASGAPPNFDRGGGIFNQGRFVLSQCTIRDCFANRYGGGLANQGELRVEKCVFQDNHTPFFANHTGGGGAYTATSSSLELLDCVFVKNTAVGSTKHGAALFVQSDDTWVVNCDFRGNITEGNGGAIYMTNAACHVINCTFRGNVATLGGGIFAVNLAPTLINCSLSGNVATTSGGGLYVASTAVPNVRNCIFWKNSDSSGSLRSSQIFLGGSAFVDFSCVQGDPVFPGNGNLNADPRFVREPDDGGDGWCVWEFENNDDFGDLRLQNNSPCIDAGNNIVLPPDTADLDGDGDRVEELPLDHDRNPRRADHPTIDTGVGFVPVIDIGAFEISGGASLCVPDLGSGGPGSTTLSLCGGDLTQPGATATLSLSGARPNAIAYLFVGLSSNPTPFPEVIPIGTLVPYPWIRIIERPTDSAGGFSLDLRSLGNVLHTFFMQAVVVQADSVQFSNAIRIDILRRN